VHAERATDTGGDSLHRFDDANPGSQGQGQQLDHSSDLGNRHDPLGGNAVRVFIRGDSSSFDVCIHNMVRQPGTL
jgi:hypothetical protein